MDNDNIIKIGIIFFTYLMITVVTYFLLSTPIDMLFDIFDGMQVGEATDELAQHLPNYRTAMAVFFSLFLSIPIVWLIMKIFSREPTWSRGRIY